MSPNRQGGHEDSLELISDCVHKIISYVAIRDLKRAALVCRSWAAALSGRDDFWLHLLRRRWPAFEVAATHYSSACMAFHALRRRCELGSLCPARPNPFIKSLYAVRHQRARAFLIGLIEGFMPASDGSFTFQDVGATPIHYRHASTDARRLETLVRCRIGGRWEWSPDGCVWSPTSSRSVTEGLLAARGAWRLRAANREIASFLERWPLYPLLTRSYIETHPDVVSVHGGMDREYWRTMHAPLLERNAALRADFASAVFEPEPALPCMQSGLYRIMQYFEP